jgi:hypothetical protein
LGGSGARIGWRRKIGRRGTRSAALDSARCEGRRGKRRGSTQCRVGAGEGAKRGGRGSAMWAGTARTRRFWAAPTAADGARLTGAAGTAVTGEDGGVRQRGRGWLTGGARRRGGPVAAVGCWRQRGAGR